MATIKKIDKSSEEGFEGSLSFFDVPPTNVAINKSSVRELLPLSAINQSGPYIFRLFSDNQFCDLNKTFLYLTASIERKNGNDWIPITNTEEADQYVGVIQNFGHSFVKTLKISISGVEVFDSGVYYAYRAYLLNELGFSDEVKRGLHEANCYYNDDPEQHKYFNKGFKNRAARFADGNICETMVKLSFDLGRQSNLLLNNSDVIISVHRNSDDFLILTPNYKSGADVKNNANTYRVKVQDIRLYVKTVDIVQSLNNAISKQLDISSAKYPMRRIEMRSHFLPQGTTDLSYNVFTNVIPRRLIIGFVSTDAYTGSKYLSPFNFEHANVRSIGVEANGNSYPASPYSFNFNNNKYIRAFVDMYTGLGMDDGDRTMSIHLAKFTKGWCFFVIPMTSTLEDTPGFELIRNGATSIKVQFNEPIKAGGYEMIVLGEFDSIISINANRVLSSDGSV